MSKTVNLTAFLNRLENFIKEMLDTFPEHAETIKDGYTAFQGLRASNPLLLAKLFNEYVVIPYEPQIIAKDEKFVLNQSETQLKTRFPQFYKFFEPAVESWETMTTSGKDAMWKHIQVLVVLCKRVFAAA